MLHFSREKLDETVRKLDDREYDIDAFIIYKEGETVAKGFRAPFRESDRHALFSVTKSFTSVAVGLLLDDKRIFLDDPVYTFFPEFLPCEPSGNIKKITVYNLLTMTAGFDEAPDDFKRHIYGEFVNDFPYSYRKRYKSGEISWVGDFLHGYAEHEPGDRFVYSDACSFMLSAIVQKVTGQTLKSFLFERVLTRIGIREEDVEWQMSPDGINTGGWGIKTDIDTLLKFAVFILNKGSYAGEQLLSPSYVEDMGRAHIPTGASVRSVERNFGYQTWILGDDGTFGGIGAFGQMYIVYPKQKMVYVQFGSSIKYMKTLGILANDLPLVFEGDEPFEGTCEYVLEPFADGEEVTNDDISALAGKKYIFSHNIYEIEGMSFEIEGGSFFMDLTVGGRSSRIAVGTEDHLNSVLDVIEDDRSDIHNQLLYRKVAAKAAKKEGKTAIRLDFYETGYKTEMVLDVLKHGIRCDVRRNLGFIPDANTILIGVLDD